MTAYRLIGFLALGIGCRANNGLAVERIGSDAVEPFAIVGGDVLVDDGSQVQRLVTDGTMRWRSDARGKWAIPRSGTGAAFVEADSDNVSKTSLLEVDMATGATKVNCSIRPRGFSVWHWMGDALVVSGGSGSIERIDPSTCEHVWRKYDDGSPVDHSTRDEFWVAGAHKVSAFAVANGAKREMDSGTWVSITPDGLTLVTEFGASVAAFDTKSLQRTWTYPGRPDTGISSIAASDRWIAVESMENVPNSRVTVTVLRRHDGKPVWSHRSSRGQFLGYIAAGGDLIAYYDSEDTSLHAVHMPDGKSAVVQRFERGVFLSTEGAGVAPAVPDRAPLIVGDIMIVYDTPTVRAYRVRLPRPTT